MDTDHTLGVTLFDRLLSDGALERDLASALGVAEPLSLTVEGTLEAYEDNTLDRAVDRDVESAFWSDRPVEAGDQITVDLGEILEIRQVLLDQDENDYLQDGALLLSVDGAAWTEVAFLHAPSESVILDSIPTRFLRLEAAASQDEWWRILEIGVFSAEGPEPLTATATLLSDTPPQRAADRLLGGGWTSSTPPVGGEELAFTVGSPRTVQEVVIYSRAGGRGTVWARDDGGGLDGGDPAPGGGARGARGPGRHPLRSVGHGGRCGGGERAVTIVVSAPAAAFGGPAFAWWEEEA